MTQSSGSQSQEVQTKEQIITTTKRFGEMVNSGQLDRLDEIITADSVDHDPAPGQGRGPDGYRAFFTMMRTAFPDLHIEVKHMVADDENVCFAYTLSGTHQGEFMGFAPTGRHFSASAAQVGRYEGGKLAERWGSTDELGILKQLGFEPK